LVILKGKEMWLFSQRGFFSIVQHEKDPDSLLVRARVKGDIERYWPKATVECHEERDYLYRTTLPRNEVAHVLGKMAYKIDYTNFKAYIEDKSRSPWYLRVWETMYDMQHHFKDKKN
jgi:hypothetical protein